MFHCLFDPCAAVPINNKQQKETDTWRIKSYSGDWEFHLQFSAGKLDMASCVAFPTWIYTSYPFCLDKTPFLNSVSTRFGRLFLNRHRTEMEAIGKTAF